MIETRTIADLTCDRWGCVTDDVDDLSYSGDGWELPEGWLRLSDEAVAIEWEKAKQCVLYPAAPEHLCPSCARDHTPRYRAVPGRHDVCVFCGDSRPCRGEGTL